MKCFACNKEETNSDVKINVERLIGVVQESFDNEQSYRLECKKKSYWQRTQAEKDMVAWHERNHHNSVNAVGDLAAILNVESNKLYMLARIARKWEQKRKWQYSFPAQGNSKMILDWLTASDKPFDSEINYINYKINQKAVKKVA